MTIIDSTQQSDESLEAHRKKVVLEAVRVRLPQIIDDLKRGIDLEQRIMGAARVSRVMLCNHGYMLKRDFAGICELLTEAITREGLIRPSDSFYVVHVDSYGNEAPGTQHPHGTVATLRFNPPLV